jgi:hypothetical protein
VSFERGVLQALPVMVAEFREYVIAHDIEFTALEAPEDVPGED